MNAFEIVTSNSDFAYLVIASNTTKAIDAFCTITEQTESVIVAITKLSYSCDKVITQDMVEQLHIEQ